MANIFINLNQNTGGITGWTASISTATTPPGGRNAVAIGESEIYATKEQAWATIERKASELDYENNDVQFNYRAVASFEEVQEMVDAM